MKQKTTKKILNYFDPIFKKNFKLKIEKGTSKDTELKIILPEEKNFFRGVSFSENVSEGAEELFGIDEINEESDLESRDVRIIAFVEKSLA